MHGLVDRMWDLSLPHIRGSIVSGHVDMLVILSLPHIRGLIVDMLAMGAYAATCSAVGLEHKVFAMVLVNFLHCIVVVPPNVG